MPARGQPPLPFHERLVLNQYMLNLFGLESFDDLAEVLVSQHGVRAVLKRGKRVQSIPAPQGVIDEVTQECDLVITGSGD